MVEAKRAPCKTLEAARAEWITGCDLRRRCGRSAKAAPACGECHRRRALARNAWPWVRDRRLDRRRPRLSGVSSAGSSPPRCFRRICHARSVLNMVSAYSSVACASVQECPPASWGLWCGLVVSVRALFGRRNVPFASSRCGDARALGGVPETALWSFVGAREAELLDLLQRWNGFFAYLNALHVFPADPAPGELTVASWNAPNLWKGAFGGLADDLFCFASDTFGNQFAVRSNDIKFFDVETGEFQVFCHVR